MQTSFDTLREIGRRHGIFTLASAAKPPNEGIEAFIESVAPGELTRASQIVGNSKPRKGRHVAATTESRAAVDALYTGVLDRSNS
ncbi:MAG: hypothetical protein QOH12_3919 [Solirubrobacteraceae bacterium]|jgi:hypothetical protein|nr:hypothetical protein [Solirubrobacteraceae bacterium]MEA2373525.1 hypothetical protein [Solirubrobacteraceae bacterium]